MCQFCEAQREQVFLYLSANQREMLQLAAHLALRNGLVVIDAGNRFNAFEVTYAFRRASAEMEKLNRLAVARAFTSYQLSTLCRQTPNSRQPTLVLDMLNTFEDEGVRLNERLRLLGLCLKEIERLKKTAPVLISIRPARFNLPEFEQMLALVKQAGSHQLKEGFMGKTLPTISDTIRESEVILSRFWRVLQPEEKALLKALFVGAKKHIAAISEANHLLPFETVQQAMLLEQAKEIEALKKELARIKRRLHE